MTKKIISLILAITIFIIMTQVMAFAESSNIQTEQSVISVTNNEKTLYYDSLENIFSSSGVYKLLDNIEISKELTLDTDAHEITLDLNGYTLTSTAEKNIFQLTESGTKEAPINFNIIDSSKEKTGKIITNHDLNNKTNSLLDPDNTILLNHDSEKSIPIISCDSKYINININKDVSFEGGYIELSGDNQILNISGKINSNNDYAIITKSNTKNNKINIKENAEINSNNIAIYLKGNNTLNVKGGIITGKTAIYQKEGTVNITGGDLKAIGEKTDYKYNKTNAKSTGDTIIVDNCKKNESIPEINISDGNFSSKNGNCISSYVKQDDPKYSGDYERITGFITGGTYTNDISQYLKEGYHTELITKKDKTLYLVTKNNETLKKEDDIKENNDSEKEPSDLKKQEKNSEKEKEIEQNKQDKKTPANITEFIEINAEKILDNIIQIDPIDYEEILKKANDSIKIAKETQTIAKEAKTKAEAIQKEIKNSNSTDEESLKDISIIKENAESAIEFAKESIGKADEIKNIIKTNSFNFYINDAVNLIKDEAEKAKNIADSAHKSSEELWDNSFVGN